MKKRDELKAKKHQTDVIKGQIDLLKMEKDVGLIDEDEFKAKAKAVFEQFN